LALSEKHFAANADIQVAEHNPPSFIVQAEDDPVHVENATVYFLALKNAKVPVEMHIYAEGGHGYGLRSSAAIGAWPRLVAAWMRAIRVLPAP
jgi:acetyl esterase/lipase